MKITSLSFQNGDNLAIKYSCDGEGVMPQLSWNDFPQQTKSFALSIEDPDAPIGTFYHLLAVDIAISQTLIKEGLLQIPNALMVNNSSGKTSYVPACPPSGTHRYIFKIFALSKDKIDDINLDNFYQKIKPFILDQAEIMTKFERK